MKNGLLATLATKTAWVAILTIAAGIVEWVFDGDRTGGLEKILLGAALFAGRDAYRKGR